MTPYVNRAASKASKPEPEPSPEEISLARGLCYTTIGLALWVVLFFVMVWIGDWVMAVSR
jgi:hypothetical protein